MTARHDFEQVNSWVKQNTVGLSKLQLVQLLEQTVWALWSRAGKNISRVTLNALFERVLHHSSELIPVFSLLKVDEQGVRFEEFRFRANGLSEVELIDGLQFILSDFLAIFDLVTGGVFTSELLRELLNIRPDLGPMQEGVIDDQGGAPLGQLSLSSERLNTGIRNLDAILNGGLPKGSTTLVAGSPGSGKTILSQQIGFSLASPGRRVMFIQTLSEPLVKTLNYLKEFSFFEQSKIGVSVYFVDLSDVMNEHGLERGMTSLMDHIMRVKPALIVIDSFKAFDDLANSREEYRKFCYEVAIKLVAWECTTLLLGEFRLQDIESHPLSSVIDGLILLSQRVESGENQRFLRVVKMRGTDHSRDEHPHVITRNGIDVYAPRVTIRRELNTSQTEERMVRCKTGINPLDQIIRGGIPFGSSILVAGVSGTGKTLLSLEFLYRGAREFNEKGIYFSFEENVERLLDTASKMGWDLELEVKRGSLEIVSIPPQDVLIEKHLLLIHESVLKLKPRRIVIDSVSVFLHKIRSAEIAREKVDQLATIVQNAGAVGFISSDIPFGVKQLSHYGVEETIVDGIVLLSSIEEGLSRTRYMEVYKLRNTDHSDGRFAISITSSGLARAHEMSVDGKPKAGDVAA